MKFPALFLLVLVILVALKTAVRAEDNERKPECYVVVQCADSFDNEQPSTTPFAPQDSNGLCTMTEQDRNNCSATCRDRKNNPLSCIIVYRPQPAPQPLPEPGPSPPTTPQLTCAQPPCSQPINPAQPASH
jgi:hypothetical protein